MEDSAGNLHSAKKKRKVHTKSDQPAISHPAEVTLNLANLRHNQSIASGFSSRLLGSYGAFSYVAYL